MNRLTANCLAIFSSASICLAAQPPDALRAAVRERVSAEFVGLETLYKELHAAPELSFQEFKTAARVAAELKRAGFDVTEHFGGNGIVGVLKNGAGPTVLVRTDLDALPVKEETGASYASTMHAKDDKGNDVPVMHACGHDMHMTCLIGTARTLAALKDKWAGTLVFIGQPAEERGGGARAMLDQGLFSKFPRPDFCLALHVGAEIPAGSIAYVEGFALASSDSVDVTFYGQGGHGAWPHTTKDPIVLAAQAVLAFQTIVSREIEPGKAAVVTVGSIHGGTKHNIIPNDVKLQMTVRSYEEGVRTNLLNSIRRIARGVAQAAGVPENKMPEVTLAGEGTAATYNDPAFTRRVADTVRAWLGPDKVEQAKPVMGAEDFGEFGRTKDKIPICMFWLGAVDAQRVEESRRTGVPLPSLHTSKFAPLPEPTLKTGVTAMSAAVLDLCGKR
ncbi:MAG: amidohydrolase [Verrucomicrobia bacterium]|nr:amidohydrolase [Verrucomicrobiota bacterium]